MNKFASFLIIISTCIAAHAQVRPELSRLFDELKGIGIEYLDIIKSGGLDGPYQLHYSIALDYRPKHYRKASGPALDSLLQRDRSLQEQRLAAVLAVAERSGVKELLLSELCKECLDVQFCKMVK